MSPVLRFGAMISSTIATALGFGKTVTPGQTTQNYLGQTTFEDNLLTADPYMFDYMEDQLRAHPDLGLGGPSLQWLKRATSEMNALNEMGSPHYPCVTFLGTKEEIVDPERSNNRMDRWTNGELIIYPDAKHEILIEVPQTRDDAYNRAAKLFDANQ